MNHVTAINQVTELIDPLRASLYLLVNRGNRDMPTGIAEKYAADMAAGNWTECAAPIVFYENGDLADGQNRLWAIIESGQAQTFQVRRNFPRAAGLNIDTGKIRNLVDSARIAGIDSELSKGLIAVARGVEDGASSGNLKGVRSSAEQIAIIARHREATNWAYKNGPTGRGMRNAPVMAAMARAWYVERDHTRLAHFATILSNGFGEGPMDSAAIALRNYLTQRVQAGVSITASTHWRDTFLKAQNAIRYFMTGKPLMQIRTIAEEAYPLPASKKGSA